MSKKTQPSKEIRIREIHDKIDELMEEIRLLSKELKKIEDKK